MSDDTPSKNGLHSVPHTQAFIFHDGTSATNLRELVAKLATMDEKTFSGFVTDSKNDFSNWIILALKDPKLGEVAARHKSRHSLVRLLTDYLSEADKGHVVKKIPAKKPTAEPEIIREKEPEPAPQTVAVREEVVHIPTDAKENFKPKEEDIKVEAKVPKSTKEPDAEVKMPEKAEEAPDKDHSFALDEANPSLTEQEVEEYSRTMAKVRAEINKVFIGQKDVVDKVIIALISDAHALLEGVPGLAKSLLVEVMSRVISGTSFKRIQFLPDMLPSDVIGGQIYDPKNGIFKVIKGPIFANFVLADEINRAPPKTHAALMECMQEKKINIDVEEFILDRPFQVLATQNPLENKGTYALPEAVLDRFMFKLILNYPEREHEKLIITQNATTNSFIVKNIQPVITKTYLMHLQKRVKDVYISDSIKNYILDIIHATRGLNPKIEGVKFIQYGAGPRASIYLGIASKAEALMRGRNYVMPEDVHAVAPDILRHRISLNFKGKAHNISSDKIVEEILMKVSTL